MRVEGWLRSSRTVMCWLGLWSAWLVLEACNVYQGEFLQVARGGAGPDAGYASGHLDNSKRAQPVQAGTGKGPPHRSTRQDTQQQTDATANTDACGLGTCFWSVARDGCQSAGFPGPQDRPDLDKTSNTTREAELYLGLRVLHLTSTSDDALTQPAFGLDIDSACTAAPTCQGQAAISCSPQSAQPEPDGPQCRDNAFSMLMSRLAHNPQLTDHYGLREDTFNCELFRGGYNVLTRISGYNGSREDGSVRVDWYTSNGLEQLPDWQCPETDFADKHALWPVAAPWSVDAHELTSAVSARGQLPASRVADPNAFVHDGYLVSHLPEGALLRFAGDGQPLRGFAIPVRATVWLGQLVKASDDRWTMRDGLIAGRIATGELLRSLRQVGLCDQGPGAALYATLTNDITQHADVLASGDSQPQRTCDALSFGISFEALQVTPGETTRMLPPLLECCEPGVPAEQCEPRCGDGVVNGVERCDIALRAGEPGACPEACPPRQACEIRSLEGTGCDAHCLTSLIDTAHSGDGCCPPGATSRIDTDCAPACGNGVVEGTETCDPPSTCPSCISEDNCLRITATGAAETCDLVCHVNLVKECRSEDGCCPARCEHGGDNDCSARCGDGRIEPGTSETCEPRSSHTCPQSCDDGDPCTRDITTGSAANCNVRCNHLPITTFAPDDGCCPSGASQADDNDCGH